MNKDDFIIRSANWCGLVTSVVFINRNDEPEPIFSITIDVLTADDQVDMHEIENLLGKKLTVRLCDNKKWQVIDPELKSKERSIVLRGLCEFFATVTGDLWMDYVRKQDGYQQVRKGSYYPLVISTAPKSEEPEILDDEFNEISDPKYVENLFKK